MTTTYYATAPRRSNNLFLLIASAAGLLIAAADAATTTVPAAVAQDKAAAAAAAAAEPVTAESKMVAGHKGLTDGYVRTGSYNGDKGYKEDDVFGDKDSDSYGYGTHTSYGNKAGDGGNGAYHESTAYDDNGKSNPKYSAWHFEDKDGRPTKRYVFDSHRGKAKGGRVDPLAVEAEASEYDSVEAYDDGGDAANFEADDGEPEYGNLYDSADVYSDADAYY